MPELRGRFVRVKLEGIPFFEEPSVYILGSTAFHHDEFARFAKDTGQSVTDAQMIGTDGEDLIEAGGRACYLSYGSGRTSEEHIRNLRNSNHGSVVRHSVATVMITGVSRGFTHELVRHAAGTAISQSSSRYIPARKLGFVTPPEYRLRPLLRSDFMGHAKTSLELYERHVEQLTAALKDERPELKAFGRKKIARGAARCVLPINLNQFIQFSMNAQAFRHVLRMRGSEAAEAEIREVACKLAPIGKKLWPVLMEDVEVTQDGEVKIGDEV